MKMLPPQNIDAEKSVLGAILTEQSVMLDIMEILRPEDGTVYLYDMEFEDWLFCANRKEHLYEAGAEASPDGGQAHYLLRFGRVR